MKHNFKLRWIIPIFVALCFALWLRKRAVVAPAPPRRVYLRAPVLLANLPLQDSPEAIAWSPNGAFLAVGGCTRSSQDPAKNIYEVLVVSVASRRILARFQTSPQFADNFQWTSDNRLWIPSSGPKNARNWYAIPIGWNVSAFPFKKKVYVSALLPRHILAAAKSGSLGEEAMAMDAASRTSLFVTEKDVPKSRGNTYGSETVRRIEGWKNGRLVFKVPFKLQQDGSSRRLSFVFSPNSRLVVITVEGWIGPDHEGVGEIWLLDTKNGNLRFLHEGKVGSSGWWNYPVQVQDVSATWSKDSKTLFFGDREFGIEELDVVNGSHRTILPAGSGGDEAVLSPDGSWVAFGFYSEKDQKVRVSVAGRSGKVWACVPEKFTALGVDDLTWHPTQNVLAWAAFSSRYNPCCATKNSDNVCSLYTWSPR